MAVTYGFYNSVNGDRKYNAEQMGQMFDGIINDGIFYSVGNCFAVAPSSGMVISIGSGRAWFNHTWTYNDASITLTVNPAPTGSLKRIDAVVIEVNENTRVNSIKLINGTAAATPSRPSLVDSGGVHQYGLAYITVDADVTTIVSNKIVSVVGTDTPFVTGPLETVSVTSLYNFWREEFEDWFDHLQDELDSNQAANLQHQIDDISDDMLEASEVGDLWTWERYDALPSSYFMVPYRNTTASLNAPYIWSSDSYGSAYYVQYKYSSSVSVNNNGVVSLVNPSTVSVYKTNSNTVVGADTLKGKYFQYYSSANGVGAIDTTMIHYLDSDVTFGGDTKITVASGLYNVHGSSQKDTTYGNTATLKYLTSDSSSTYPEDGKSGDYWYTRIGKTANPYARIVTGTYVGTGTYGSINPTSITLPFSPKYVWISANYTTFGTSTDTVDFMFSPTMSFGHVTIYQTIYKVFFIWRNLTVSWYVETSGGSAKGQLNNEGTTYYYIAIG